MYKLSEIIGKNVVSLFEAENTGTLVNVLFDKNLCKIRYFEVFSDEEEDVKRKFFDPSAVSSLYNDAVVIKNGGRLLSRFSIPPSFVPGPVNAAVYNPFGVALGRVTDVTLDGFSVVEINVGEKSFAPSKVLSKSEEILIINDTDEKIRLVPPVKKIPSPHESAARTVKVNSAAPSDKEEVTTGADAQNAKNAETSLNEPDTEKETSSPENADTAQVRPVEARVTSMPITDAEIKESKEQVTLPSEVDVYKKIPVENVMVTRAPAADDNKTPGYSFLIGKKLTRTLLLDDGTVLADEGSEIDERTLEKAGSANKLVLLALHSR